MKLEITITNDFLEYLKNFETADAAYLAAQDALFDHLDADDNQWDALKSVRDSAYSNRDDCAVVLARFLVTLVSCLADASADAPADAPEDASADVPEDAPEDVPVDATEDAPEDVLADTLVKALAHTFFNALTDAPVDVPVQSAKCKICPCSVDGRCFFVPDQYDSDFTCQSPAWDDFFKSGGSRSPAPRARASPL